jgi:hypothetical protein
MTSRYFNARGRGKFTSLPRDRSALRGSVVLIDKLIESGLLPTSALSPMKQNIS